ncbi:MAG: hypothetical protein JST75_19650 [Bacteroidetes bacterium]|nr:hypothetical protein [Bacteroidota bacterium]
MKRLILCSLFIPFAGFDNFPASTVNLAEVRTGDWPITLERNIERRDTTYSLEFRDQQVLTDVVLDTLEFPNLQQLKYFEQALTVLKKGNNGDIAKFKDYTIKRAEKKYEGIWYILRLKYGSTDFRQPEADLIIKTIRGL